MTDADSITHLDWTDIACQCGAAGCRQQGGCPRPAAVKVSVHALDKCDHSKDAKAELDANGNYTLLVCLHCLRMLELGIDDILRKLNRYGRPHCETCGAPAKSTRPDVIREVIPL